MEGFSRLLFDWTMPVHELFVRNMPRDEFNRPSRGEWRLAQSNQNNDGDCLAPQMMMTHSKWGWWSREREKKGRTESWSYCERRGDVWGAWRTSTVELKLNKKRKKCGEWGKWKKEREYWKESCERWHLH